MARGFWRAGGQTGWFPGLWALGGWVAGFSRFPFPPSQAKVHLLFEAIHLGNLHFYPVSQRDHTPGAATDQLAARLLELVKIIRHAGEMHQSAHGKA